MAFHFMGSFSVVTKMRLCGNNTPITTHALDDADATGGRAIQSVLWA
jgi:hypothetical protein